MPAPNIEEISLKRRFTRVTLPIIIKIVLNENKYFEKSLLVDPNDHFFYPIICAMATNWS